MAKQALGKGLGALIRRPTGESPARGEGGGRPEVRAEEAGGEAVRNVSLAQIVPSPLQPRKDFPAEQLDELVASIREHGVIQPLIVREAGGKLELIAGERRLRACQQAGLAEAPVIVRKASDRDVLELALIENLQRADLNPLEEAEAYVRLAREFGLKQEEIARRVGKSRAAVANSMRLVDLDPSVQAMVVDRRLTVGHAKALLAERDPERQRSLAEQIARRGLNVRAAERMVASGRNGEKKPAASESEALDSDTASAVEAVRDRLRERFATKVNIHHTAKRGRIEIEYYGNDDLDRVLALMGVHGE